MIGGIAPELKMDLFRLVNSLPGGEETRREDLINWFMRFYVFVAQTNIVINAAIATRWGTGLIVR